MRTIYGFDEQTATTLKAIANSRAINPHGKAGTRSANLRAFGGGAVGAWQMEATTAITAASGDTAGSGTAKILYLNSGDLDPYEPGSSPMTATVYNAHRIPLASGDRFMGIRTLDGVLWVAAWSVVEYKPLVRFTLAAAMTTSEASKSATITAQYGPGQDNTTSAGGITVHNMLTSTGGVYLFEGDSGDAGLAQWDSGTNYRIVNMECP